MEVQPFSSSKKKKDSANQLAAESKTAKHFCS